jgi:hypothetical protein
MLNNQPPPPPPPPIINCANCPSQNVNSNNPDQLWCKTRYHWVAQDDFGDIQTCARCRERIRQHQAQFLSPNPVPPPHDPFSAVTLEDQEILNDVRKKTDGH